MQRTFIRNLRHCRAYSSSANDNLLKLVQQKMQTLKKTKITHNSVANMNTPVILPRVWTTEYFTTKSSPAYLYALDFLSLPTPPLLKWKVADSDYFEIKKASKNISFIFRKAYSMNSFLYFGFITPGPLPLTRELMISTGIRQSTNVYPVHQLYKFRPIGEEFVLKKEQVEMLRACNYFWLNIVKNKFVCENIDNKEVGLPYLLTPLYYELERKCIAINWRLIEETYAQLQKGCEATERDFSKLISAKKIEHYIAAGEDDMFFRIFPDGVLSRPSDKVRIEALQIFHQTFQQPDTLPDPIPRKLNSFTKLVPLPPAYYSSLQHIPVILHGFRRRMQILDLCEKMLGSKRVFPRLLFYMDLAMSSPAHTNRPFNYKSVIDAGISFLRFHLSLHFIVSRMKEKVRNQQQHPTAQSKHYTDEQLTSYAATRAEQILETKERIVNRSIYPIISITPVTRPNFFMLEVPIKEKATERKKNVKNPTEEEEEMTAEAKAKRTISLDSFEGFDITQTAFSKSEKTRLVTEVRNEMNSVNALIGANYKACGQDYAARVVKYFFGGNKSLATEGMSSHLEDYAMELYEAVGKEKGRDVLKSSLINFKEFTDAVRSKDEDYFDQSIDQRQSSDEVKDPFSTFDESEEFATEEDKSEFELMSIEGHPWNFVDDQLEFLVETVERKIGYTFIRKGLVIEALTDEEFADDCNVRGNKTLAFIGHSIMQSLREGEIFPDLAFNSDKTLALYFQRNITRLAFHNLRGQLSKSSKSKREYQQIVKESNRPVFSNCFRAVVGAVFIDSGCRMSNVVKVVRQITGEKLLGYYAQDNPTEPQKVYFKE
ncbi:hypothetical protein HK098_000923 [Nowakowskiella sp. JEL0407]|nr:hypothetical protein HK098_000923 [Nowakowskiella sp. JEL0407]